MRAFRFAALGAVLFSASVPKSAALSFPRDHGAHPEAAIEWWYYTGHLRDPKNAEYGFQLTFFRFKDVSLAHFAWSDVARRKFRYEEKMHLTIPGVAAARVGRLSVVNEDWSTEESSGVHRLRAAGKGWELSLDVAAARPPVVNGAKGISLKGSGPNEYSNYVSITRLEAKGEMRDGQGISRLTGTAWFDHEWGPGALPQGVSGWDWFALQLDDRSELMLYRMRTPEGKATPFSAGTFVPRTGPPRTIRWDEVALAETVFWKSPRSGGRYPAGWKIAVASIGLDVEVAPLLADQELITEQSTGVIYWEGTCRVEGRSSGRAISGRAYAELTGYARHDVPGFASTGPWSAVLSPWSRPASTSLLPAPASRASR